MESERFERMRKTTFVRLAMETNDTLKKIEEDFSGNPESMGYFYELYKKTYTKDGIRLGGQDIIATMCIQVPEELIYAVGAAPLRLCSGAYSFEQVGAEFMPAKSCSLVKATLGMLHVGLQLPKEQVRCIVVPTTCDQKKKSVELIEAMGFAAYALELPPSKESEEARHYWRHSVNKFGAYLQKLTGVKLSRQRVRQAIMKTNRARAAFRKLYSLRKAAPSVIYGKDIFMIANAYFFDEVEKWTDAVEKVAAELDTRKDGRISAAPAHAPRILFTGSPSIFPNLKIPLLIEQSGGVIVADEVCSSTRLLYDAGAFDEPNLYDMVPSIADRYMKPCTCPCFARNEDRKRKLLEMAREVAADGVVYQSFSGCNLYEMEQRSIARSLEEAGIPMIHVETDYSPEDTGQLTTRIEAFLEATRSKKRRVG